MDELDAFCRRGVAVRDVDDLDSADIETMLTGHGSDLGGRTDKNRNDDAGLRASTAPRSELSSQGCTTMVLAAGTLFARVINRSYFEPRT